MGSEAGILGQFALCTLALGAGVPAWVAVYILRHQIWPLGLIALMSLMISSFLTLIAVLLCIWNSTSSKQIPILASFFSVVSVVALVLGWLMWSGHLVERLPKGPILVIARESQENLTFVVRRTKNME